MQSIDLKLFLLQPAQFQGFVEEDLGVRLIDADEFSVKRAWHPPGSKAANGNPIGITEYVAPQHYCRQTHLHRIRLAPDTLPHQILSRMKKTHGRLAADSHLYRILQDHPELPVRFPSFEPIWSLVRFSRGASMYHINVAAPPWAGAQVYHAQVMLAKFLTDRFAGIIWDPQHRLAGLPNPQELFLYSASAAEAQASPRKLEWH